MAIPRLKGDSKYKDAPRFDLIYSYEGKMKADYNQTIKDMTIDLADHMKKLLKIKL